MSFKDKIIQTKVPKHIAIIMDGNGRWAEQKGEHRIYGHTAGVESVREALTAAAEIGVKYLTLYAFSTENWNRPKDEVDALMDLLVKTITSEVDSLNKKGVRLDVIGDMDSLPPGCSQALEDSKKATAHNTKITLILALSYSSRWEITNAIKKIATDIEEKKIEKKEINDELISSYLNTANFPDPELLIRTSGECRISNFLLWQVAYAELYFTEVLWPDFKKENLYEAVYHYQNRERRFGKTSAQLLEND